VTGKIEPDIEGRIESGIYVRPCEGETLSGDVVLVQSHGHGLFAALIDVLGHGPDAHRLGVQLSAALSGWLPEARPPAPEAAITVLHDGARGTRGAAAAVAWLDTQTLEGWVVGVGNVRCRLFGAVTRTFEFGEGVLGQRVRTPRPVLFTLQPTDVVILFSDGVAGRFRRDDYPSLGLDPAPAIAFNVVRRFGKSVDDASCAVMRCRW
jgi:negative regulator of sigma-B (phosphoserine phosphatase)